MLKGLQTIFGLIGGLACPVALAVLGYFTIFKGLDWIYLLVVFLVYLISVALVVLAFPKGKRYGAYCEMMGGGFGWVWMLSIVASIGFFISAMFMSGSWWEFGYSFLVGGLCKGWTRSFRDAQIEDHNNQVLQEKSGVVAPDQIIQDFGACMLDCEDCAVAFYDETKLPHPKSKIFGAVAAVLETPLDDTLKEQLKASLLSLAHFQPNVGDSPVYESQAYKLAKEGSFNAEISDEELEKLAQSYLEKSKQNEAKLEELRKLYELDMALYLNILKK